MAKSGTFQTKQTASVRIATEATMGTAAVAGATQCSIPVTDYSFDEMDKHSLSVAPTRVGLGAYSQSDDMVKFQRHDRMYDISITFHATAQSINKVCGNLFGDSDGTNTLIGSMPTVTDFTHDESNTVPVTLWFENAGHAGQDTDMIFASCMCPGLTFTGDISSNGGVVMCTATFQTAYTPTQATLTFTGTERTISAQQTMFNMHDFTKTEINSGSAEDLLLYSFELTIARPVNRIGFDSANSYRPMGYALGGYEVTGSLTCKRDAESTSALGTGSPVALDLDTGVYEIVAPSCMIDQASISFDDDGWKQTIPFRCVYAGGTSSTIVSINTQA